MDKENFRGCDTFVRIECQNALVQHTIEQALDRYWDLPSPNDGEHAVYIPCDMSLFEFVTVIQETDPAIHFCCDKGGIYARAITLLQSQAV